MTSPLRHCLLASAACLPALLASPHVRAQEAAVRLSPVEVTATPIEGGASYVPVTTLSRDEIATLPAQSLGDALRDQPGLSATTFAPGASRPVIRGLDGFRVRMQENGIGVGDVSAYGEDHAVPIDPLTAERISVIRGPASLRWGSQAIGGVVAAENNRIPTELIPEGSVRGRFSGGWNSTTRGYDGTAAGEARVGNVVIHADLFARDSDDYRIPGGGRQDNSFVRSNGQALGLTYFFDQGFIGTSVSRFDSRYGIPGGESAELGSEIDMEQIRWASRGEFRPSSGPIRSINAWLGYTHYQHDEIGAEHEHHDHDHEGEDHDHDEDAGGRHVHGGFRNHTWDARLEMQHVPVETGIGALNGTLGVSLERERLRTSGEAAEFLPPADTDRYAGYVFEELSLTSRLRLQAAFRIESVTVDGATALFPADNLPVDEDHELSDTPRRRRFAPISVSLGLVHDLPWGLSGRVTGQYVERAPSAAELFSRGSHHASGTFDIGNPDLGVESARTAEIGVAREEGPFRFDASLFYADFSDFIYRALTGNTCDEDFASCAPGEGGEFRQTVYGQRDARFYGAEITARYDVLPVGDGVIGVSGRYDLTRARFASGGGNVPRIPPHRLGAGLYWHSPSWQADVDWLHAFDQNRTGENETRTAGYDLVNARIAYTARFGGVTPTAMTFSLIGSNLLDEKMRNAASFKKDEVLLPGRSVRLLASVTF